MNLLSRNRKKDAMEKAVTEYFSVINAYTPAFTSFEGSIYEMELTRSVIHSFATHVSKLKPEIQGSAAVNRKLGRKLQYKPNPIMDTKKYLYRLATEYMCSNNAIIAPLLDDMENITGFYALDTGKCRLVDYEGVRYLRYDFGHGKYGACELSKIGIMNQYQKDSEMWGSDNQCLRPTMDLISTQNQGIIEGIKSSAAVRFIGKLAHTLKEKDIQEERKNFRENNLAASNNGGIILVDSKYEDVKQIDSKPFIVNPSQMAQIKESVYTYFGTNEKILKNNYTPDEWNAYYEGKIEPFALECSLVHTNMTYSEREIEFGNQIMFTANRLQYLSNNEKLSTVTQLFDRGLLTVNQGLEIFNMPPVENGDRRYIRKEYTLAENYKGEE